MGCPLVYKIGPICILVGSPCLLSLPGHAVAQLVQALCYKLEGRRFDSRIDIILPPHYGPGVDLSSSINEYQEYFLRSKGGRCFGLTTFLLVQIVMKYGTLKFPESSGPVQGLLYLFFDSLPHYCVVTTVKA